MSEEAFSVSAAYARFSAPKLRAVAAASAVMVNNFFHNKYSLVIVPILAEVEKSETFMFKKVSSTFLLKW